MRDLESVAQVALQGRRVLLVDDDEINLLVAGELLGDIARMHVTCAAGGEEALRMIAHEPFDVVLMDLRMPDVDGYQATARLRELPNGATVPVIAVSAHVDVGDRGACLAAGMNDLLTKPFDARQLLATLRRWLTDAPEDEPAGGRAPVPAFSAALGLQRCMGRRELYERIARRFLETRLGVCDEMAAAWEQGRVDDATRIAHSLISSAGTVGASALSELARTLQAAARARDDAWWRAVLGEARAELARVRQDLEHWLATPAADAH